MYATVVFHLNKSEKPSPQSAHQKALRLQKKVFRSLKAEVELLLGKPPHSIQKYEKENRKDFSGSKRRIYPATKEDLIEAVRSADVTFIADFHTFDQAQRTALRIIRETTQESQDWMIGLEMVSSEFQKQLDDFQSEKLTVEEFHEAISYREDWGFPWGNYAPIFEWAKQNQIRLIALNHPKNIFNRTEEKELHQRDQWTAGIIADIFQEKIELQKRPRMIVLYGELHIGTRHLPSQLSALSRKILKAPLSWVAIHQNDDPIYWKLARQDRELETEVVKLKKNVFCVFSSTPWAKLQSLISWLEGEAFDTNESELDYLSILRAHGNTISEFLGESPPSFEAISTCTIDHTEILDKLSRSNGFTAQELRLIRFHVTQNQRLYIPRAAIAYLGSPSHNAAAELAAIHLLKMKTRSEKIFSPVYDDFFRLILEATFGFFGSLILNPRRKCDLSKDHLERLKDLNENGKPSFPFEKESRMIALHLLKKQAYRDLDLKSMIRKKSFAPAIMMGARYLGQILGTQLHQAVLSEDVKMNVIHDIFLTPPDLSKTFFENKYKELIQLISKVPTAMSKTEHF